MIDHEAMLAIQQELDGVAWTAETLERIAEILRQAGYRIRDLDDRNPGAEVSFSGAEDPESPAHMPGPRHVLAILQEARVRDQIAAILETDRDFGDLTPNAVTDENIHNACLAVAATIDFSEEIGTAEFRAALTALGGAGRRHTENS
jgi:UDP-N-acetylmuramate-alanine ligase